MLHVGFNPHKVTLCDGMYMYVVRTRSSVVVESSMACSQTSVCSRIKYYVCAFILISTIGDTLWLSKDIRQCGNTNTIHCSSGNVYNNCSYNNVTCAIYTQ